MLRFMKTRNIIMLVAGITIFVAAAVVFIVAMVVADEPGFMHEDKRWTMMPLDVGCRGHVPERDSDCEHVQGAIERINRRLDFEALRYRPSGGVINVILGTPAEPSWDEPGGVAELHWEGDRLVSCDVRTINTGSAEILDQTIEHELGHCLGLADDRCNESGPQTSIMCDVQRPVPMGTFPPHITDSDRALLREAYDN